MLSKFQGLVWGKLLVEVFRVRGGVVHGEADTDVLVRVLILRCPHIYRLAWWPVIRQVVRYTASGPLYCMLPRPVSHTESLRTDWAASVCGFDRSRIRVAQEWTTYC